MRTHKTLQTPKHTWYPATIRRCAHTPRVAHHWWHTDNILCDANTIPYDHKNYNCNGHCVIMPQPAQLSRQSAGPLTLRSCVEAPWWVKCAMKSRITLSRINSNCSSTTGSIASENQNHRKPHLLPPQPLKWTDMTSATRLETLSPTPGQDTPIRWSLYAAQVSMRTSSYITWSLWCCPSTSIERARERERAVSKEADTRTHICMCIYIYI